MTTREKAIAESQIDNDSVIVTQWRFATGAETGWHKHGFDYVVVPGLDGKLLIESKDDDSQEDSKYTQTIVELKAGQSYFRKAGVEHNVVNANDFDFSFVEIELK